MEEFHGQFKIGGGKKKEVLLDWRGNEKEEEVWRHFTDSKSCQIIESILKYKNGF